MLLPVAVVVGARAALLGVAIVAREVGPDQQGLEVVAWILALATPALAVAFAIGIVRFQLFAGRVLQDLAANASTTPDAIDLERTLARAFADPALQLAFPQPGTPGVWADASGRPLVLPGPRSGRCVFEVADRHGVAAVIVCDEDLQLQPELTDAAASLVAMTLHNQRLEAGAAVSLRELEASRARLATSAERERRRIERDLHDGAQQRLVALRIELELAEELLEHDPAAGKLRLKELEHDVDDALEELRALAHGVYPPVLADRGLAEALRAVAARSPVRVEIEAHAIGRYAPELESAVYYAVLEALQNALKHAKGVRRILVRLDGAAPGELRFSVRDDGAGIQQGAALGGGAGITSMRDRVSAFGGRVDIASAVGVGTTVRGVVRVDAKAGELGAVPRVRAHVARLPGVLEAPHGQLLLAHEAGDAEVERRLVGQRVERDQHHGGPRVGGEQPPGGLDAVHVRHADVEQHQVGTQPGREVERLRAGLRLARQLEPGRRGDQLAQRPQEDRLIVHRQDTHRSHARYRRRAGARRQGHGPPLVTGAGTKPSARWRDAGTRE